MESEEEQDCAGSTVGPQSAQSWVIDFNRCTSLRPMLRSPSVLYCMMAIVIMVSFLYTSDPITEDWFCALQPVLVRAAPRESAARRGVLVAGQRIQAPNIAKLGSAFRYPFSSDRVSSGRFWPSLNPILLLLVVLRDVEVRPGQVQDSEGKSWIRLTLQELWRSCRAESSLLE